MHELEVVSSHRHTLWLPTERKIASACSRRAGKMAPERSCPPTEPLACLGSVIQQGRVGNISQININHLKHLYPGLALHPSISSCKVGRMVLCHLPSGLSECVHFHPDSCSGHQLTIYIIMHPDRCGFLAFFFPHSWKWRIKTLIYLICVSHTFK